MRELSVLLYSEDTCALVINLNVCSFVIPSPDFSTGEQTPCVFHTFNTIDVIFWHLLTDFTLNSVFETSLLSVLKYF